MAVIVEPDSASAWIGLVGVAVGAAATGGIAWLRDRTGDRQARRKELIAALDAVRGAAMTLMMAVTAFGQLDRRDRPQFLDWLRFIAPDMERVQIAAETVRRLGPEQLGNLAHEVADKVIKWASDRENLAETEPVHKAIRALTAEMHRTGL